MFFQPKNLKSENSNPWFKQWFNILLRTQSIVCATVDSQCLEYLGCITLKEMSNINIQYQFYSMILLISYCHLLQKVDPIYKVHLGFIGKWPHGKNHYLLINCVPPQDMIDWLIKKYPDNNWRAIGSYFRKLGKTQFPVLLLTAPYLGAILMWTISISFWYKIYSFEWQHGSSKL